MKFLFVILLLGLPLAVEAKQAPRKDIFSCTAIPGETPMMAKVATQFACGKGGKESTSSFFAVCHQNVSCTWTYEQDGVTSTVGPFQGTVSCKATKTEESAGRPVCPTVQVCQNDKDFESENSVNHSAASLNETLQPTKPADATAAPAR